MTQSGASPSFTFIGADGLQIVFFQGGQSRPESTQQTFTGATWTFYSDGTFVFQPPITAPVRNDLYPIVGLYTIIDQLITFQGEQYAPPGVSASLDGTIVIEHSRVQLSVLHTLTSASS